MKGSGFRVQGSGFKVQGSVNVNVRVHGAGQGEVDQGQGQSQGQGQGRQVKFVRSGLVESRSRSRLTSTVHGPMLTVQGSRFKVQAMGRWVDGSMGRWVDGKVDRIEQELRTTTSIGRQARKKKSTHGTRMRTHGRSPIHISPNPQARARDKALLRTLREPEDKAHCNLGIPKHRGPEAQDRLCTRNKQFRAGKNLTNMLSWT